MPIKIHANRKMIPGSDKFYITSAGQVIAKTPPGLDASTAPVWAYPTPIIPDENGRPIRYAVYKIGGEFYAEPLIPLMVMLFNGLSERPSLDELMPTDGDHLNCSIGNWQTSTEMQASPAAQKLAAELGIDINTVTGTGSNGRVVSADVRGYWKEHCQPSAEQPQESEPEDHAPGIRESENES